MNQDKNTGSQLQAAAPSDPDLIAAGALRQYRHNDDDDGSQPFVIGYDAIITDREFARLRAQLARQQAAPAAIPEGWKLVPINPTPKMVDATFNDRVESESHNARNKRIYATMLAAAPAHPAMPALLDHAHAEPTFTEAQIIAAARAWVKHIAVEGGINADDYWNLYGSDVADDIRKIIADLGAGEVSQGAAPTAPSERDAVLEEAAEALDAMNDSSGDAAAYDQREQNLHELEREHAIADCAKAVRALKRAAQPNIQEAGK